MSQAENEGLAPLGVLEHQGTRIQFATPNRATKWRVDTFFKKEPVTLEWIAGFRSDDVLVDVGANVGMYSIWAACTRGTTVFAFEPESQNFALLNRNIMLNDVDDRVSAYCLALSDHCGLGELHLSEFVAGSSCHSFDEPLDPMRRPFVQAFTQGCVASTLDALIAGGKVPAPSHVKIDVDGFEPQVIRGAAQALRSRTLRSLLIEVNQNLDDHLAMVDELNRMGFRHDPAQVKRAERASGPFRGCAEYVFIR